MPRLFVSVDVPEEVVAELRELHTRLRETDADLNLVDPEKTHVTLKFLGETDEDAVDEIEDVVEGVTESGHGRFEVELLGTGVFPSRDYISVVWAGVSQGSEELTSLHESLEEELVPEFADAEDHDFTPHVTLARMNSARGKKEVQRFLDETESYGIGSFEADSVRLKKSTLRSDGPVYEIVYEADLG